jgi:hypothetical protein
LLARNSSTSYKVEICKICRNKATKIHIRRKYKQVYEENLALDITEKFLGDELSVSPVFILELKNINMMDI